MPGDIRARDLMEETNMPTLFSSYRLGALTLPNRVVMAPMTRVRAAAGGLATPRWRRTTRSGPRPG